LTDFTLFGKNTQLVDDTRQLQFTIIDIDRTVCGEAFVIRSSVCLSVSPSVCPTDRQQQRPAVGLLLRAWLAGDIDRKQATALSSKCEQCRVNSRGTMMSTNLLLLF